MGVSGCGKTSVASGIARELGWEFIEADTLHSAANVAKMASGTPLDDDDRRPWLDSIAQRIDESRKNGRRCVVACSALKRRYRERLEGGHDDVLFVYLQGPMEMVAPRLAKRQGHYMPASLLQTQYEALEEPGRDENALVLPIDRPVEALVGEVASRFS